MSESDHSSPPAPSPADAAFAALVAPHQRAVRAHCYRMLGSLSDSEDALQETLVRAWRGLATFEGRASLRTWLHRIATHVCLDHCARRPPRVLPETVGPPLAPGERPRPGPGDRDAPWIDPAPPELWQDETPEATLTARESVRLAFLRAIQRLPANQRAVLLLRDVLGWSAQETADLLETSVPAVTSALQRARATMGQPAPAEFSMGDDKLRALLARYVHAWETGTPEEFAALLREDALLTMPPLSAWISGGREIADFVGWLRGVVGPMKTVFIAANGAPAVAFYARAPGAAHFTPQSLHVIEPSGDRIHEIHAFVTPTLFPRFGLPPTLDSEQHRGALSID